MRSATTRHRARSTRNPQAGGTVVEFAIVLPLFFAMLFGTIDYAWYMYQKFTLSSAVQTGLRTALSVKEADVPGPWITARDAAIAALNGGGAVSPASVTWGPAAASQVIGLPSKREVRLSASFTFTPLVGLVRMPSPTMTYTGTMLLDAQNADI